jgi:hypothetical protein
MTTCDPSQLEVVDYQQFQTLMPDIKHSQVRADSPGSDLTQHLPKRALALVKIKASALTNCFLSQGR